MLCEKPLSMSVEEAEHMAKAAQNVPTLVWFNYRRVPAIALAKKLVDEGRLGQIYHYRATYLQSWGADPVSPDAWRFKQSEAGSGAMGDLLSHSIDLALMLNGSVDEVSALVHTFTPAREVDDAVLMLARFANGSMGTLRGHSLCDRLPQSKLFGNPRGKGRYPFRFGGSQSSARVQRR